MNSICKYIQHYLTIDLPAIASLVLVLVLSPILFHFASLTHSQYMKFMLTT